jgi:hypothetical protein
MRVTSRSTVHRGRRRMRHSLFAIGVVSLCSLMVSGMAEWTSATPPSLVVYFVNPPGLAAAVEKHFGEPAASRVLGGMMGHVNERPPLVNPYGAPFIAVKDEFAMLSILVDLWRTKMGTEDPRGFVRFLTSVNKAPIVRGMVGTPGYSGCVVVLFSLAEEHGRRFLDVRLSAFQFRGCGRTAGSKFETHGRVALD